MRVSKSGKTIKIETPKAWGKKWSGGSASPYAAGFGEAAGRVAKPQWILVLFAFLSTDGSIFVNSGLKWASGMALCIESASYHVKKWYHRL